MIDVVPSKGAARDPIRNASHFSDQNIAHARVSIRTADGIGAQQLIPSTERYVLVEEIQSDYVQNFQGSGRQADSPFINENDSIAQTPFEPNLKPIKGVGDATRLSLLQTIMYAKENGVNFVIVPSPEDIAYAGRVMDGEEIPKGFYNTYRDAVKKALSRIQQETKGQVSFGTETYTPQEEFITGEGFLESVPMRDTPQTPRTVTIIDISKLEIDPERTELRFNKGGLVPNMEDQTMAAFGQPTEVDPMSGNPVPPGGTPEGVRDDIDAKLSEGEFVIPAHVVRFVGVTQLMQLIQAAEKGLQQMEQGGMMGQPVQENAPQGDLPFDPNTLETEDDGMEAAGGAPGFSQGGLVQDSRLGKAATTPAASQLPSVAMYRDRTGFIRAVPIINGQPVGVVPPDSQLINNPNPTPGAPTQNSGQPQQSTPLSITGSDRGNRSEGPFSYNVNELSGQEARQMLGGQRQISDFTSSTGGRVARSIGAMVPGLGPVMGMAGAMQQPITNALANQVLEKEYGAPRASLADNMRGRTSFSGANQLGRPANLLDQLDRGRESGGSNISVAEHTRTSGQNGTPDNLNIKDFDNFKGGWGYVTDVSEGGGGQSVRDGSDGGSWDGPGGANDYGESGLGALY